MVGLLTGSLALAAGEDSDQLPETRSGPLDAAEPTAGPPAEAIVARSEQGTRLSRGADRPTLDPPRVPSLDSLERQSLAGAAGTVGGQHGQAKVSSAKVRRPDVSGPDAASAAVPVTYGDPRDIARSMLGAYGWSSTEFSCLDQLWTGESGWQTTADNPTSSAYGIPQALPGDKMSSAGADWATNAATQIEWGLGYIRDSYGSPCSANSFKLGNGWY